MKNKMRSSAIRAFLHRQAPQSRIASAFYRRFYHPNGEAWADVIRRQRRIFHMGVDCSILPDTNIIDPEYTWLGDRVVLTSCTLVCHDGSIQMLYKRHGLRVDRIGPIVIENDVFVGIGALVLGGVTIGEGSIIGAGSVVRQSVPAGSVVTGNPARVAARIEDVIRFWEAETMGFPWAHLIAQREGSFDPAMEPELRAIRQRHFFGKMKK